MIPLGAYAKNPRWVKKIPKAGNDTYRFVVETGMGTSEATALNKAMARVYQNAISSLGLSVNTKLVEQAINTGTPIESIATDFRIPVNKVCSYTQQVTGGYRVHVLCQVAVAANIQVRFDEFRDCGSSKSEIVLSGRPDEWGLYDNDDYFSYSTEAELDQGEKEKDVRKDVEKDVCSSLVRNLNMTEATADPAILSLILTKTHFNPHAKTLYAVAFIKRDDVNRIYSDKVTDIIDVCFHKLEDVQSYVNEGSMNNAIAMMDNVKVQIDKEIMPRLNFLRAHCNSRSVDNSLRDVKDMQSQLMEKKSQLRMDAVKSKKDKVQEYVKNADRSKRERKLSDALRYYYGAQVLLHEMQDMASVKISPSSGAAPVNANQYIIGEIKDILSGVKISFDGFLPGSNTEAKLSCLFNGEAVTNLNYTYNDNTGWSDELPVKDGWTVITLRSDNHPKSIHVKLEYRYEDEASFDPELKNAIAKHRFDYDKEALHIVEIIDIQIPSVSAAPQQAGGGLSSKVNTSFNQNVVANRVMEKKHEVSANDSSRYAGIIQQVCQGINDNRYDDIHRLFTADGCMQLENLLKYGKARVLATTNCRFVRVGNEVMCRSIPMSFSFKKGKKTLENVIFTFDSTGKIDGIQFALEERAAHNIMCDNSYSETAKLALVNFMENYKTAFAMKRLDYINSIFADDAVIIVGRMLKRTNQVDRIQKQLNDVAYTRYTKGEYIDRLAKHFDSKEWINIKFSNTSFEKSSQGNIYSIQLLQDYSSDNYGDRGYLFLLIDCTEADKPLIKVRTWQPEVVGPRPFSMADYDDMVGVGRE